MGGNNLDTGSPGPQYSLEELEAIATIKPIQVSGGKRVRMGCPFHGSDKQRSLEVNLDTGRYGCFSCNAWGYLKGHNKSPAPPGVKGTLKRLSEYKPPVELPAAPPNSDLDRYLIAAQRHIEDPASMDYLKARRVSIEVAKALGLGYFPPGKWQGRKDASVVGRIAFPLYSPAGQLIGIHSRAVDPHYPDDKVPSAIRHDIWGTRGIFNVKALGSTRLHITEGCFDAIALVSAGYPDTIALSGSKGIRWTWLGNVQQLYLCLDLDAPGCEAARELAREAVLHGIRVYVPDVNSYGGYKEPADQWEAQGKVTLNRSHLVEKALEMGAVIINEENIRQIKNDVPEWPREAFKILS
jgi:DNA primase